MPSPANKPQIIELYLAIIGGGVAGLWLLNRGQSAGDQCALFAHKALGSDQTLVSQGMIYGRVDPVTKNQCPELLRHKHFKGSLYRIQDLVIDLPSLLANLTEPMREMPEVGTH